ncbi:hypothetical protein ABZ958_29320 [Streptomyces sp. NPDC046237]|uniref:hypothetical protein n=1 Tax=Streptomyces sp. NPDC046237 TaxID=3154914 RepID=UPI0033D5F882
MGGQGRRRPASGAVRRGRRRGRGARRLLLDGHDTYVTQETAEGLLERWDVVGLRLVLAADAVADDDAGDHLRAAILNVCLQSYEDEERLHALCAALASDVDPDVRAAARSMLEP